MHKPSTKVAAPLSRCEASAASEEASKAKDDGTQKDAREKNTLTHKQ